MSAARGREEEGPARRVAEAKLRRKGPSGVGLAAAAAAVARGVGMGPGVWRRVVERRRLRDGRSREKAMGSGPVGVWWDLEATACGRAGRERRGRGGRLPIGLLRTARRTPGWGGD